MSLMHDHAFSRGSAALLASVLTMIACEPEPEYTFELDVEVVGEGVVISAPAGLECDDSCDVAFAEGTRVTLQARPRPGSLFQAWGGDCAVEGKSAVDVVDVVIDEHLDCTATFIAEELIVDDTDPLLTLVVIGPGNVLASGGIDSLACGPDETCIGRFIAGGVVVIEGTADAGAELVGFSGDCDDLAGGFPGYADVAMDGDRTCTVSFFAIAEVTYPMRIFIEGRGSVTSSPAGVDCDASNPDCVTRFAHGTFVSIVATPDPGWTFRTWGHACAQVESFDTVELEMTQGLACSAVFERQLLLTVSGNGRIDSPTDATITCDFGTCTIALTDSQSVELTATADAGHRFVGWGGACVGSNAATTVPPNASDCTALFEPIPAVVTVVVVGGGSVTSTDGNIACPSTCTTEVTGASVVDPGEWTCDPGFMGSGDGCDCGCGLPDPDCSSSLASACQFTEECGGFPVVPDRNHLCSSGGGGTPGITLVADPADGFVFSSWQGCGLTGSAITPAQVVPTEAALTCTAVFVAAIDASLLQTSPRLPADPIELAVSSDGTRIAVVADSVMVLDATTAQPLRTIAHPSFQAPTRAALDDNGGRAAIAYGNNSIDLVQAASSGAAVTLTGHPSPPSALAFAPVAAAATNGFASGDNGGRIKLWSTSTGLVQRTVQPHGQRVAGLAFVSDAILVSAAIDGSVATTSTAGAAIASRATASAVTASCGPRVCVVATASAVHVVSVDAAGALTAGAVHALAGVVDLDVIDATHALVVRSSGAGGVLDLATGAIVTLAGANVSKGAAGGGAVATRVFLEGSNVEVYRGAVRVHGLTSVTWNRVELLSDRRVVAMASSQPVLLFADGGVQTFASAGPATRLVRGAGGVYLGANNIVFMNATDDTRRTVLNSLSPAMNAFAVNDSEDRLAVAQDTANDNVIVYELPIGDPFRTLTGHGGRVNDVAFAGGNVLTACADGDVRVFAVATGTLVGTATAPGNAVPTLLDANAFGAVAGAASGELMFIDVTDGSVSASLALGCPLTDVALSFDGSLAAVTCSDRIVLVDTGLGSPRGQIDGAFSSVRFAPDELVLLTTDALGWMTFALSL